MRLHPVVSFLLMLCCLLPACSKTTSGIDPRTLETDAGAAVIRQLVTEWPQRELNRKMCIVLGPEQLQPSEEFMNRFTEFKGRMLKRNQVTATNVGGVSCLLEKTDGIMAGDLILLLQISEIKPVGGGYEAIGAWAYKDTLTRRKYTLTPEAGGAFKVTPGEILDQKTTR